MGIAKNIKELREKYNLTQSELGKIAGVSDKAVSTWETGAAEPRMGAIQRIADHFGITKGSIIEDKTSHHNISSMRIPVLGEIAAGIPIDAIEDILDYEEIESSLASTGEFFALRVKGDSMEPRIKNGDVVIVRKQSDAESGSTVCALVNGDTATVKKLMKYESGISLVASNAAYEPMYFSNEQIESLPVRILGRVVELRGKF